MSDDRWTYSAFIIIDVARERYLARDGAGALDFKPFPPEDGGPFDDQMEMPEDAWIGHRGEAERRLAEVRAGIDPEARLEEVDQDD